MCGKEPDRNASSPAVGVLVAAAILSLAMASSGSASSAGDAPPAGLWDSLLEKFDVKASPAEPPPDFVRKSRPDPSGLGYIQPAVPHKVSPLAVKTPDQIQAEKDALDAARARQLQPGPRPKQLAKAKRAEKAKPAPAVTD